MNRFQDLAKNEETVESRPDMEFFDVCLECKGFGWFTRKRTPISMYFDLWRTGLESITLIVVSLHFFRISENKSYAGETGQHGSSVCLVRRPRN